MKTFVVRVFVSADAQPLPLAGIVEHVSAGRREAFEGGTELLQIVQRELELDERADRTGRGEPT
jgi:hypothetical protein